MTLDLWLPVHIAAGMLLYRSVLITVDTLPDLYTKRVRGSPDE